MRAARTAHVSEPRPVQVIPVSYDLILWSSAKVGAFPRAHRFTVGDRLITRLMDTLALLVSAQFTPARRAETLREANLALEQIRYLFRLAKDLRCLSLDEYEFAVTRLSEKRDSEPRLFNCCNTKEPLYAQPHWYAALSV